MDGLIVLDKPPGRTSHDMVNFVRRLFGIKKVGHTGTLDPDATGVLPICIGKATKAADMLTASDKAYRARLVFGMTTDTLDASGEVLTEQPVTASREEIENAIKSFIGEIDQIPPMFSAIKKDGRKLCDLARSGISVEREKRRVKIYGIDIIDIDTENHTAVIDVDCSKGTYIRTLCEDIGMKLGCGAYMDMLVRTKSAGFTLDMAYTAEQLSDMKEAGTLDEAVIPVDKLFGEYQKVVLNEFLAGKAKNGIKIRRNGLSEGEMYRVYAENGEFLCLSRYTDGALVLEKAFWVN
ncbi:MAG: tRNA pseudouridine(55) synthase TruB [Clostridiales bacterium]|nr:tRNA pseudouridine(55) synthase TruB [Clostridiales bacterium]